MNNLERKDVVTGYYGFSNFGDDLFRDLLSSALQSEDWARPAVSQNYSVPLAKPVRNILALANLARARSLTLGGGSILGARPPLSIRHLEMAAARYRHFTYCAIGVGLLEHLPDLPSSMIKSMGWLGLRSEREYLTLKAAFPQVRYMSDLAYAAKRLATIGAVSETEHVAVAIIPAAVGELGKRSSRPGFIKAWLQGNLPLVVEGDSEVKLFLLQPDNVDDQRLCTLWTQEAQALGWNVNLVRHRAVSTTLDQLRGCKFVFTDRLHGAIVSHLYQIPFRLSAHHQKCKDFLIDIDHPDGDALAPYGDDLHGGGVAAVRLWSDTQAPQIKRHSDLAASGIKEWLGYLKSRVC
jgi:hypothetical protein